LTTPIRELDDVSYWVIESPDEIYDFMNNHLKQEWVGDAKDEGRRVEEDVWLLELPTRKWRLEVLSLREIKADPYKFVPRTGYNFEERLAERCKELRKAIENYGSVIWPVTVREEDMLLVDGYCRFTTLQAMKIPRIYAYMGRM